MTEEKAPYIIGGLEFNTNELAGVLVARMIEEFKVLPDVWQKLSEKKQEEVLSRLRVFAEDYITKAVDFVASDDRPVLQARLDQVVVKDGLKATLTMPRNSDDRHELIDAQGKDVLLVVVDYQDYTGGVNKVRADKDQPDLNFDASELH